jgi:hypothetical protein
MKTSVISPLKVICSIFTLMVLFSGCEGYGSDNIPTGADDLKKSSERYDTNSTGIGSAAYNPKDTAKHDKTQMQPANSTGAH